MENISYIFREKYNIPSIVASGGYVYCKIKRGMYGFKQATQLTRDQLIDNIKPFGYYSSTQGPNIWVHKTKQTTFCFCVDDFRVKYFSEEDASHLISTLQICYTITIDKVGFNFCGLHLEWSYQQYWVDISMPTYVLKILQKLEHPSQAKHRHAPHRWVPKTYGQKIYLDPPPDTSDLLTQEESTHIQRIVG